MVKGNFRKLKGLVCLETNLLIESANICDVLPRPADSYGLTVVKIKQNLKYRANIYF